MIDLLSFFLGALSAFAFSGVMVVIAVCNDKKDRRADQTKSSFEVGP